MPGGGCYRLLDIRTPAQLEAGEQQPSCPKTIPKKAQICFERRKNRPKRCGAAPFPQMEIDMARASSDKRRRASGVLVRSAQEFQNNRIDD